MPFLKLTNNHKCILPTNRDDGSALQIGDVWRCDEKLEITNENGISNIPCGKIYELKFDQREGTYWAPVKSVF